MDMRASGRTTERGEITARKLRLLVERYRPRLGNYEVITLNESVGYIIRRVRPQDLGRDISREVERDTLLCDFDDAIGATTVIKGKPDGKDVGKPTRFTGYKAYLEDLGIAIEDEQVEQVINTTDAFVRREYVPQGGLIYNQRDHAAVLAEVTKQLLESTRFEATEIVAEIVGTLNRIKRGEKDPSDPFYFNQSGQLVMTNMRPAWTPDIEDLFMNTMIKPPYYPEVLDAMKRIGNQEGDGGMDLIGMTHGDPPEQLRKFFEMLCDDPDLPIEEIWLTQVGKGDFVRQVAKERGLRKGAYVHFDDSKRHIQDTVTFSDQIGGVLSVRDETKEGKRLVAQSGPILPDLVAQGKVGVIRFSTGNVTAEDIVGKVQLVRGNVRAHLEKIPSPQAFQTHVAEAA